MNTKLLMEFKAGAFDALCRIANGSSEPSIRDLDGNTPSDLFVAASETVRQLAISLYLDVRNFEAREFMLFMSETYEGDVFNYLEFEENTKVEVYDEFYLHVRTKNLVALMKDENFNALCFTGYSDGLAVLHVQNPKKLRTQVLEGAYEYLSQKGHQDSTFLALDFKEQKTICSQLEQFFVVLTQCLDSAFPQMSAST